MRPLIVGSPDCCNVDNQAEIFIISSLRILYDIQETRFALGVIHSDKHWSQITTNSIVNHPIHYMHSLEVSKSPQIILRRSDTVTYIIRCARLFDTIPDLL